MRSGPVRSGPLQSAVPAGAEAETRCTCFRPPAARQEAQREAEEERRCGSRVDASWRNGRRSLELCSLLGDDGGRCHHFLGPRARAHTSVTSRLCLAVGCGEGEEHLQPPWVPCEEAGGVFVDEAVVAQQQQQHRVLNPSPPPPSPSPPPSPLSFASSCSRLLTMEGNSS